MGYGVVGRGGGGGSGEGRGLCSVRKEGKA